MARPAMFAWALMLDGAVPEVPESESHGMLSLAVQLIEPPPRSEILITAGTGFGCPWKPLKTSEVGLTPSAGAAMTRVTPTESGLFVAPGAFTMMVAVYVPCARPAILTEAVSVPALVPDEGDTVS